MVATPRALYTWYHFQCVICFSIQLPTDIEYFGSYVVLPEVRKAIHVGNLTFNDGLKVEEHLREDICQSVIDWVVVLANNYRVSIFFKGD